MKLAHFSFVFRRVFRSLRDLIWTQILTSGTMAMTLFVFGGFLLLQGNLQMMLKGWSSQLQVFAYMSDGLMPSQITSIQEKVRSYPEVSNVRYITKENAWRSFKQSLGSQSGVLEGLKTDILPSSLEVALNKQFRGRAFVKDLASRLREIDGISEVEYPEEWIERLSLLLLGVQWAKWIFGGFLFVASLLIVGSTVKLAIMARKDEIEIMQLVGAPESLIKIPIVIEGMIQGLVGAMFSLLLLWLLYLFLGERIPSTLGIFISRGDLIFLNFVQILFLFLLGWCLGAVGSLFSLRRFLRT